MHEPVKLDEDQVSEDNEDNHLTLISRVNQPRLPRPWELQEFPLTQEEEELETFIKEDSQYWDYHHETYPDQNGELVQFKTLPTGKLTLFQWLPWGTKGRFEPQTSNPIMAESSVDAGEDKVQLSEAQIEVIEAIKAEYESVNPSTEPKATIEIIQNEISGEETIDGKYVHTAAKEIAQKLQFSGEEGEVFEEGPTGECLPSSQALISIPDPPLHPQRELKLTLTTLKN
ncbi:uncharacterized protein EI90DRAFT_3114453 [Cantharellus anzutake]|uniref:uncharacterized protein n=1 Tax=Cantharellus anzutake TaxID=1750568 RepID=UPI001904CBB6|nr:uncharacterized protein EI90DRAFT_3114453 [Cantharellus anzutake]KAF8343854.1 hypothetical protein EI90DRAFT_3114453 [Cantharellus anzutake]